MSDEASFSTIDGLTLRYYRTTATPAKAVLVFVHGYLEHAGRYREIADRFAARGFTSYAFDLRGHGRSDGPRAHAPSFARYLDDLERLIATVRAALTEKLFLVGHSFGGLVALAYAIDRPAGLAGVAVSAPYLRSPIPVAGSRLAALRLLSVVAPTLQLPTNLESSLVSRDPEIVRAYGSDPLVLRKFTPRWAASTLAAQAETLANAPRLRIPCLVMQGSADRIADPSGARDFYARVTSSDRTFIEYAGFYHELFNEAERSRVYSDLERWLEQRT